MLFRRARILVLAVALLTVGWPAHAAGPQPCTGTETWTKVGTNVWRKNGLPRSQGVTSTGRGWIFSWQGGISRTNDAYVPLAVDTFPPQVFEPSINPDLTNHIGPTHIGDVDQDGGVLYAPEEDGGESLGPLGINQPEYQKPYVVLYNAKTLLPTGVRYTIPTSINGDGVPWVGIDHVRKEVYDAEWGNPNNRFNVFDMQMHFKRFLNLDTSALGTGFRLSRIQGAEVFGNALYAARDDAQKTIYKVDMTTGVVTKAFALNPPFPSELEGIAVRSTPDGALLHVLLVRHQVLPLVGEEPVAIEFQHWALHCS